MSASDSPRVPEAAQPESSLVGAPDKERPDAREQGLTTVYAEGAWEVFHRITGETVAAGYSERWAHNAITWAWNTGGDVSFLDVRHSESGRRSRG